MPFTIDIVLPMPEGNGTAKIYEAKPVEGKWGTQLQISVEDEKKRTARGFFPLPATVNNLTGKLLMAIFGELKPVQPEDLIGKTINVVIKHNEKDGQIYANIIDIL